MTHHAIALTKVVRRIIEKFGDARLTAVKLSKVYARSKDKECKVFEASIDDILVNKSLMLKIDTGKSLIQEMVLRGYLAEKSSASFSGYSASYVIVGPNANELLYNNAIIKLTLSQAPKARTASDKSAKKGDRDRSVDLDGGDGDRLFEESSDGEIFNAPSPPVRSVPATKQPNVKSTNKKAKRNVYTLIDDMDAAPRKPRQVISLDTDDEDEGGEEYDSHAENRFQKTANLPAVAAVSAVGKPSDLKPTKKKFRSPDLSSNVYSPPTVDQIQNLDDSTSNYIFPPTQQPELLTSPLYMDVDSQPRRSQKRANDEIYDVHADVSTSNNGNPFVAVRDSSNASLRPPALLSVKQKRAFTTWMDAYKRRFLKYWQVFGTDTIPEIVKLVPLSVEDVVNISGMGEVKGRTYGDQIVATVYSFLDKNDLLHLFPHAQPPTIKESMEWSDPIRYWEMKDNESRQKDHGEVDYNHSSSSRDSDSQLRHVDDFFSSQPHILEPHSRDRNSVNDSRQSAQIGWGVPTFQNPPDHHSQSATNAVQIADKEEDDYHYSSDDEINASNFLI